MEQREKEESASMPVVKGKAGRAKPVKVKQETMPTPQGRRVIPRITQAIMADANRKAGDAKRVRKVKVGPAPPPGPRRPSSDLRLLDHIQK